MHKQNVLFLGITVIIVGVSHAILQVTLFTHLINASREYKNRLKMAPAAIVKNSGVNIGDIEDGFRATERSCIVLSSDWRGYQDLSKHIQMGSLAGALSHYYDICETALEKHFPEGNYYLDWIADELFVVIFQTVDSSKIEDLADSTISMCFDLMREKHFFYKETGYPKAIDIGISFGEAYVGMMGPKGFRKVTALGEVPGRARRMQSLGGHLRTELDSYDRVIFGKEFLDLLSADGQVFSYDLPEGLNIKDVSDRNVFFLLPRYDNSASPPGEFSKIAA